MTDKETQPESQASDDTVDTTTAEGFATSTLTLDFSHLTVDSLKKVSPHNDRFGTEVDETAVRMANFIIGLQAAIQRFYPRRISIDTDTFKVEVVVLTAIREEAKNSVVNYCAQLGIRLA